MQTRNQISHRKIARSEAEKLGTALYKVGDVIVTKKKVKSYDSRGKQDGYALPGWKWRIIKVAVVYTTAAAMQLEYTCVSHDEPQAYSTWLKEMSIDKVIGRHEGELLGRKQ